MSNRDEQHKNLRETKDLIYSLFYQILGEIKDDKISIEEDEYEENLQKCEIPKLISYIKDLIQILLEKKVLQYNKEVNPRQIEEKDMIQDYEYRLKKYEEDIKALYRKEFAIKIQKESLEIKIENYIEMEQDFEEMKKKLKSEDGKFQINDRKDDEILKLRTENCNLKNLIKKSEEELKETDVIQKKDLEKITILKAHMDKLAKKIRSFEHNQKDLNSSSNSSINININNHGNPSAKWILKNDEEPFQQSSNTSTKNMKFNNDFDRNDAPLSERSHFNAKIKYINSKKKTQEKSAIVDNKALINSYNRIFNDEEKNISPKKTSHQKNNSVYMQEKKKNDIMKYFSNNQPNQVIKPLNSNNVMHNNFIKISNMVPNPKIPLTSRTTQQPQQYVPNPINKMYISSLKGGCNSANRSSLSIKSNKADNN